MDFVVVQKLFVAAGLGLLVGLQREWTAPHVAGLRTFALLTIFGTVIGLFDPEGEGWLIGIGLVSVAAMMIVGNVVRFAEVDEHKEPGLTTQAAGLVMYMVGVAIGVDRMELGIVLGGGTAVLLHWKKPLHSVVKQFGEGDLRAIIQLVLIALVILPLMPNETYGPYDVLNPFEIWLIVVLIVGISLAGFICIKFMGPRSGSVVGGILGGVISSTATTVSYARRAGKTPEMTRLAALIITIASTIVFVRVLVEVAIVAPGIFWNVAPPLFVMLLLMTAISAAMYFLRGQQTDEAIPLEENPSELKAAIVFGLLYAAVLFAVAAVQENFDDRALYFVAALSGLTEMDAITISTAQMVREDRIEVETGWRMILVGALSNLAFKAGAAALLGSKKLLLEILIPFGLASLGGVLLILFWP